ncbi:MAG: hypothetical protein OQK35_04490, partial [Alphaproteobacteria bacterium]|nr:hypothetical protein [Alphaproteobacteria bacterium]
REVRYEIRSAFYRDPPNCVTVLKTLGKGSENLKSQIEVVFARHLTGKVARVVSPLERRRMEKNDLLDTNHSGDRRRFAFKKRCPFFIQANLSQSDDSYYVVWSEKKIGLKVSLFRAADNEVFWRAEHTARRGDGGVPITPMALVSSAVSAGKHEADKIDVQASILDDAARRILKTLPDVR